VQRMTRVTVAAALVALAAAPVSPAAAQAAAPATRTAPRAHPADVRFMQGMIAHHAQAITMSALIPARSTRQAMRLMGERITVSQRDEIAAMSEWLRAHGEAVPDTSDAAAHGGHGGHAGHAMPGAAPGADSAAMPGMMTPAEMAALAAARDVAFERLFLQSMIRHHEGALVMVKQLFASTGAAQDGTVFRLASDVDADQRAEIARMRALIAALPAR
jgi:uncharacterized protein (DUF305 family)